MEQIFFATSNSNKFTEAESILAPQEIKITHFRFDYNEIRSDDLETIAIDAVNAAYHIVKRPVFVEDTGLFIDALNGFPGTYSGWVFRKIGTEGILRLMAEMQNRTAEFRTCIAYANGKETKTFFGVCTGIITHEMRGKSGFGYDPVFVPLGKAATFAESKDLKNTLSHRYKALEAFANYMKGCCKL